MTEISLGLGTAAFFLSVAWYFVRKLEHDIDPVERLRSLAELRENGLIDEKEHEKLRKRQISRLRWYD
ncbi:MAG: hypothetical protein V2J19_07605 [Wenzhouxiangella sp.]|jgi:hypothetical protein|nr:hypothetical protein [Wenzhouxiangella sp.]